jgi:adenylyltransferase/sulfurtransferase
MVTPADRHHRQTLLPGWGEQGQRRLADAAALVVGVGALGCASAELLARAGVGRLVLVDRDVVEPTNLHRQGLYAESDLGRPKAIAAADRLARIDSALRIEPVVCDLLGERALDLVRGAAVLVDGTDNFVTRLILNDAAVATGTPYVYAGAVATSGTLMPVLPGVGPCLRCVTGSIPHDGETCDTAGVFGPVVWMVGARQAALALRLLLAPSWREAGVRPRLERLDAFDGTWRSIDLAGARDPACPCCAEGRFEFLDGASGDDAVPLCGRNSVQITPGSAVPVDQPRLRDRLAVHGRFALREGVLEGRFDAERGESGDGLGLLVFADGRAIVTGTSQPARARSIYARYIGG